MASTLPPFRRPLLIGALAWGVGILIAWWFQPIVPVAIAALILLAVGVPGIQAFGITIRRPQKTFLVCCLLILGGVVRTDLLMDSYNSFRTSWLPWTDKDEITLSGTLSEGPIAQAWGWWLVMDRVEIPHPAAATQLNGSILVRGRGTAPVCGGGDRLTTAGRFELSKTRSTQTRSNDYLWALRQSLVGQIKSTTPPEVSPAFRPVAWTEQAVRVIHLYRQHVAQWLQQNLPDGVTGLGLALVTGQRYHLKPEDEKALLDAGLIHLTAISGLHVSVVALVLPWLLKPFGWKRRSRALVAILLTTSLVLLVGGRIPVLRAALVGTVGMLALYRDRPTDSLNLLGGAALLILLWKPFELLAAGFQLSFGVTAALLTAGPALLTRWRIQRALERVLQANLQPGAWSYRLLSSLLRGLLVSFWVSFIAVLASLPFTAYHFGQVNIKAVISNLMGVPLASAATCLGAAAVLFHTFSDALGQSLLVLMTPFLEGLLAWSRWCSHIAWGSWNVPQTTPAQLALLVSGLSLVWLIPTEWVRKPGLSRRILAAGLIAIAVWWPGSQVTRGIQAHFLDIGQGDAALIRLPNSQDLLVDCGPPQRTTSGLSPLAASLRSLGVTDLEAVILSHLEVDHFGGIMNLLSEMRVKRLVTTGDCPDTDNFRRMAELVKHHRIPVIRLVQGDCITLEGLTRLDCLHPTPEFLASPATTTNDRSLVIKVVQDDFDVLFTGDIGAGVEKKLVKQNGDVSDCEVLKVAHHGSRFSTSQEFVRRVAPDVAIISCGENHYGHPTPEVIQRLQSAGSLVSDVPPKGQACIGV